MFKKEYTLSRQYFEMAMPILKKLDNRYRIAGTYAGMGELYNLMGNYDQAQSYYLQALALATALQQKMILKEIYAQLTQMEKKRGRFEKALHYFELATAYNDSLYNEGKAKTIAELETRYESEKKDQQIQLLARDNRIRALWTDILIAALALLAAASVLVYYLQRYRERKNRQILNLEIEQLTSQHRELSEKYKNVLSTGAETAMDSQDQRILKRAVEVVEENISDPAFSVEKMAREMGMSRTNMHRKIKAITGFPPNELIRSIRLRKAALMLLHQTDTVSQISLTVGFEDHSYFSKAFKKQFGVPPSEYFQSRAQGIA
jgi:AraC-like DNA-binding protein